MLGLPAAADASIIYSGIQNRPINPATPQAFNFNPLQDADVTFTASSVFPNSDVSVTPGASNALNMGPLAFGAPITLANTTDTVGGVLVSSKANCCPSSSTESGPWATQIGVPAYLGVRFAVSGQDYLGWAQLSLNTADGTLIDWAYEDTPGVSIAAGAGAVPEPSSLALLAMGSAGILALRRRRRAV